MPNRILKETICTSESISQLRPFEEITFYRLIVNCDDYGRFDGRVKILKSRLYPLENYTEKQINDAINKLQSVGIVQVYNYNQMPYLQIVNWSKHQNIRNKKSKYPEPDINCEQSNSIDSNCEQLNTSAPVIQSESESKYISESEYKRGADKSAAAQEQVVISLIQNDGNMYGVTDGQIARWTELYPAVDIMQELRRMCGWLEANPTRRKTSRGIPRFINTWLSKAQDKGGDKNYNNNSAAAPPKKVNAYGETEDEFFERLKNEGADLSGYYQGNTV